MIDRDVAVVIAIVLLTLFAVAVFMATALTLKERPEPPVAYCVVPNMWQRAREEDIPIGVWAPCKHIHRTIDI